MDEQRTNVGPLGVDEQGRIAVPAGVLEQLQIRPGDSVPAWLEGDRLVLQSRASIEAELRAMFRDVPGSMADDLIAERRAEAAREALEG